MNNKKEIEDKILSTQEKFYINRFELIENAIYETTGITLEMLQSKSRMRFITNARIIYSNFCHNLNINYKVISYRLKMPNQDIGRNIRVYGDRYKYDSEFKTMVDMVNNKLKEIQDGN